MTSMISICSINESVCSSLSLIDYHLNVLIDEIDAFLSNLDWVNSSQLNENLKSKEQVLLEHFSNLVC